MRGFKKTAAAFAVMSLFNVSSHAQQSYIRTDAWGTPFLELRFFAPGDGNYKYDNTGTPVQSAWTLTDLHKDLILAGIDYWGRVIKVTPGASPAIINVGTESAYNAYANARFNSNYDPWYSMLQIVLQNQPIPASLELGAHSFISLGTLDVEMKPFVASQLPSTYRTVDLAATVLHEVVHAMGVVGAVDKQIIIGGLPAPKFLPGLTLWTSGLRDDNGQAAQPGQDIWCTGCANPAGGSVFDLRQDNGYFTGANVTEVMNGAMNGVPIKILGEDGTIDFDYMGHFELKNSLMSHQAYRNYVTLMEAELAVLQDLGYNIDRRNLFGSSIYGSGLTIVNDNGYFSRNADGSSYIDNTYNSTIQGLGLHVYGSHNTIAQRANLLSSGAGGAGIRVDGEGNSLTILPGTRVHANGANGRAVMFTYGKDHTFVHRGDAEALGLNGIAASFDFGTNAIDMGADYRGSYIYVTNNQVAPLLAELDGPLVSRFDLTGRLAGQLASIYMSPNAYVGNINIMNGASLSGDIISQYNQKDGNGNQRLTALTLGLTPDADGRATSQADNAFKLRFDGNIQGINNIDLQALGGLTELNGTHQLYRATIAQGATLAGNSNYQLNSLGTFTNNGTFVTGTNGSTQITGDYVQSTTGTLQVGLSADNTLHNLVVSGHASISGTLVIAPQRGWYANHAQFSSDKWIDATSLSGSFHDIFASPASPTLGASVSALGNNNINVTLFRGANAYSRYASTTKDRQIGVALDAISGNANNSLQSLFSALDFSAINGSQIQSAFEQLAPDTYSTTFYSGLLRERRISQLVSSAGQGNRGESEGYNFAIPFASHYRHGSKNNTIGSTGDTYGVVFGTETGVSQSKWQFGLHGAVTGQSVKVDGEASASGKSTAFDAGAHLRFAENPYSGPHAYAQVRFGVDDNTFDRTVSVNGYNGKSTGKWTGLSASTAVTGGWRWQTGEQSSVGAIAGVDYTVLHRPNVVETGEGAPLALERKTFNSLRSQLGGEWQSTFQTESGKALTTTVQAIWHHELRDSTVHQRASFAGYESNQFSASNKVTGKNSISVQAGLSYQVKESMRLNAGLSSTLWKAGDAEFGGSVSFNWRF
jgi:subtilase-type serine protease